MIKHVTGTFFLIFLITTVLGNRHHELLRLADSLRKIEKYSEASRLYSEALEHPGLLSTIDLGNALLRKGFCLIQLDSLDLAFSFYFGAFKIFDSIQVHDKAGVCAKNLSYLYSQKADLSNAVKYAHHAHTLFVKINDSLKIAESLNDLGSLDFDMKDYQAAIRKHMLAINSYKNIMPVDLLANHLLNLGNCYKNSDPDSSLYYWRESEKLILSGSDFSLLPAVYNNLAEHYKEKKDFGKSIAYFQKSLDLSKEYPNDFDKHIIFHNLSELYDSLKNYSLAYRYSQEELRLTKSIFDSARSKYSAELSEKYESEKKDQLIKTQKTENQLKSRNLSLSIIGFLLALGLAAAIYVGFRRKKLANELLTHTNLKVKQLNEELGISNQVKSKLFSIIGHDIRGPIASLHSQISLQNLKNKQAQDAFYQPVMLTQIEMLLETLEELLIWSKSQLNFLSPEYEKFSIERVIAGILELTNQLVADRKISVETVTNSDLNVISDLNMCTIILRNILTNAFKYAKKSTAVTINLTQIENYACIEVKNQLSEQNTEGTLPASFSERQEANSGLGIILIRDFTSLLNGQFNYYVDKNSITASLKLPLT